MSSTLQPATQQLAEPKDRAYRQICAERSIGHLINVMPESEVYRFGNGGLTSTERVTVPVVFADHLFCCLTALWKALCYPCTLVEMLLKVSVLDIKGSSKALGVQWSITTVGRLGGWTLYCVTLSPKRYAGLLKLENSPDPPTSRLRLRPTSLVPRNCKSRLSPTLKISLSLQQQHLWTAQA